MTILVSLAAIAMVLAWPTTSAAQGNAKARSVPVAQQQPTQRQADLSAGRVIVAKPCAARTWAGCQGWDPDPNVRMMIQMDAGRDDY